MNKKVKKIIKKYRKKRKMTQEDLAKILNVSASMISYWETGKGVPDEEMIPQIANILNINQSKFYEEKIDYKIIVKEKPSKFSNIIEKIFEKVLPYTLVTILLLICFTIINNFLSNDMFYGEDRQLLTNTDKKVIQQADKNLEIIKNSTGILDEKAKEEKEKMIEFLEAFSNKLHNYEDLKINNNYHFMLYILGEYNIFDMQYCSIVDDENCDIKKLYIYEYPMEAINLLVEMDKKVKDINDADVENYNIKEIFPDIYNNALSINNIPIPRVVLNAYYPSLKISNLYEKEMRTDISINEKLLDLDKYYLEITKEVMKVGGIHE